MGGLRKVYGRNTKGFELKIDTMKTRISSIFLSAMALMSSCAEKPEPQPAPVIGKTVVVELAVEGAVHMIPAAEGKHYCEIPFTISKELEEIGYNVEANGFSNVEVVVEFKTKTAGSIKLTTSDATVDAASVVLKVTQKGYLILPNWCSSNTAKFDFAKIELSQNDREFVAGGNPGAKFGVRSNVGFDVCVPGSCNWINVKEIRPNGQVTMEVLANEKKQPRSTVIEIWDSGHNFNVTYTARQQAGSYDIDELRGGDETAVVIVIADPHEDEDPDIEW